MKLLKKSLSAISLFKPHCHFKLLLCISFCANYFALCWKISARLLTASFLKVQAIRSLDAFHVFSLVKLENKLHLQLVSNKSDVLKCIKSCQWILSVWESLALESRFSVYLFLLLLLSVFVLQECSRERTRCLFIEKYSKKKTFLTCFHLWRHWGDIGCGF